jgi:Ca2+-binding RTX toxin-like protein
VLIGGLDADTITGGSGSESISGGNGNDVITGGDGADTILGGDGNDVINGGDGADRIDSGVGADSITGGAGADTFFFAAVDTSAPTNAALTDTITDFVAGTDFIEFDSQLLPTGNLAAANYVEVVSAADYAAALVAANAAMSAGTGLVDVVAVQVGTGVYVFIDDDTGTGGTADSVVFLSNQTLAGISEANFKVV